MPLTDTIKRSIVNWLGLGPAPDTDWGRQIPVAPGMEELDARSVREDRKSTIQDCRSMARSDPRVAYAVKKYSQDAALGGVIVTVEAAPSEAIKDRSQAAIVDLLDAKRMAIGRKLVPWTRSLLLDGDLFGQIAVEGDQVSEVRRLAAEIMVSAMTPTGEFPEGEAAYWQEHPQIQDERIKEFEKWEVVHARYDAEDGAPYGTPMFAAARLAYRRLNSGEKNIAIRRVLVGANQLHHKIGTVTSPKTEDDVLHYIQSEQKKRAMLPPGTPDIYTNENVEIVPLITENMLGEIKDIEWFEVLLTMVTGIPYPLFNRLTGINRDVFEQLQQDYERNVQAVNDLMEIFIDDVIGFQLLLMGVDPSQVLYEYHWASKDRDTEAAKAEFGIKLQSMGYSFQTIHDYVSATKVLYEEELKRIETQKSGGIVPYGIGFKGEFGSLTPPPATVDATSEANDEPEWSADLLTGIGIERPNANGNGHHGTRNLH